MLSSVKVSAGKNMVRKLKPFMAVEENCRGSDELYDNGYSRKTSGLRVCSSCLDETRLRLWNSLYRFPTSKKDKTRDKRHLEDRANPTKTPIHLNKSNGESNR